jgi:hypothetical protein
MVLEIGWVCWAILKSINTNAQGMQVFSVEYSCLLIHSVSNSQVIVSCFPLGDRLNMEFKHMETLQSSSLCSFARHSASPFCEQYCPTRLVHLSVYHHEKDI